VLITDYRAAQRSDLRDLGCSAYFDDEKLDEFHARSLRAYSRYRPYLMPFILRLIAGEENVELPEDWLDVHRPSFDAALGLAGGYTAVQTSYSLLLAAAEEGRPPMSGLEMDFSAGRLTYDPYQPDAPGRPTYTFLATQPPRLVIRPAPTTGAVHPIFYFASHRLASAQQPGTLPDAESDLVLAWACHLACEALLGDPAILETVKVGDRELKRDEFARQLAAKSDRKRDVFDRLLRYRPIGAMG